MPPLPHQGEALVLPLPWSVLLPGIPIAQQPCPRPPPSTQLGQREPIVPTRTGPCPAARLRDGHFMPVSPPPVPMLSLPPPLTWGVGCSFHLLVRRYHCPTLPLPHLVSCAPICLSVCLYSPRRSILPHIKLPSCPLRPPSEPASLFPATRLPRPVEAAHRKGAEGRGGRRRKMAPHLCHGSLMPYGQAPQELAGQARLHSAPSPLPGPSSR